MKKERWMALVFGKVMPVVGVATTVLLSTSAVAYAGHGRPTPIPEVPYSVFLPGGLAAITYVVYKLRNKSE